MRRFPIFVAIAGAAGFVGHKLSTHAGLRKPGLAAMRNRMMKRMMASMPEDSPPRLVKSILPRLEAQNEEILALLKEQNDLLRRLSAGQEQR
ncbi:MAG: hypothetical protein H6917_03650 [Novosphingobium sp.]|nr:hypothetical protein [Novosphingobium sp.]MCP5401467.1 hypothetical protein [Novosphingobium sp.]